MKPNTALLIAGMLIASSATLFAQQQTPPTKPTQQKPVAAAVKPATTVAPAAMAQKPAATKSAAHKWTVEQIKEAQTSLAQLKLYTGKVDGMLGRGTRHALREFERTHGLPVTGRLSDSVLVLLKGQTPQQ
jgi:peptidoglycan hydrolase-like protein with peptidoglycan-binding domain